jgi:site-specific DNA-methyltransferase (adenine-specific)
MTTGPSREREGAMKIICNLFEIYREDCVRILRKLPDRCVDAIVMDPPYWNDSPSRGKSDEARSPAEANPYGAIPPHGLNWLLRRVARESKRLVKPGGFLLCFCDTQMAFHIVPLIESCGPRFVELIVWDKGDIGTGAGFRKQHELIALFAFGAPRYHDHSTPTILRSERVAPAGRLHQNQKPLDLLTRLIKVVTPRGGRVLDPFMGIGTVGISSLNVGRQFLGVELEPGRFDTARKALQKLEARLAARNGPGSPPVTSSIGQVSTRKLLAGPGRPSHRPHFTAPGVHATRFLAGLDKETRKALGIYLTKGKIATSAVGWSMRFPSP